MGIFELNLTMVVVFLLLAIIPSEVYVFGHIFGRSKSYRKALPSRCSSQLELSGTPSPISRLFYSRHGEKIHFQGQSACTPAAAACQTRSSSAGRWFLLYRLLLPKKSSVLIERASRWEGGRRPRPDPTPWRPHCPRGHTLEKTPWQTGPWR